jgi:hypothetical protein
VSANGRLHMMVVIKTLYSSDADHMGLRAFCSTPAFVYPNFSSHEIVAAFCFLCMKCIIKSRCLHVSLQKFFPETTELIFIKFCTLQSVLEICRVISVLVHIGPL